MSSSRSAVAQEDDSAEGAPRRLDQRLHEGERTDASLLRLMAFLILRSCSASEGTPAKDHFAQSLESPSGGSQEMFQTASSVLPILDSIRLTRHRRATAALS
jgi:hypothetical protein